MDSIFEMMVAEQQRQKLQKILECNQRTESFGLALSEEEAKTLMVSRKDSLKESRRVEFGEGILPQMIDTFCDSQYINQEDYADTLIELQDLFYQYKNESGDKLTGGGLFILYPGSRRNF